MKKVLLILVGLIGFVVIAAAGFVATKPSLRPASTETIERTPERLARGKYLTEHVLLCFDCHSERDLARYSFPPKPGLFGGGGNICLDEKMGLQGFKVCPPNLTPDEETGIGRWTDGEIMRAIREGVDKDGKALFAMMPYKEYAHLSDEDTRAVVAHLRTLRPIKNEVAARALPGPLNIIVRFMPAPLAGSVPEPNRADPVAYGGYLATVANCKNCHTPTDEKKQPIPGREFAGGNIFKHVDFGQLTTPNLTPHATGLGERSKGAFIGIFKAFASPEAQSLEVAPKDNTVMPFLAYAGMTEDDLGAIYAFLRTIPPIENAVERRKPPAIPAPPAAAAPASGAAPAPSPAASP